MASRALGFLTEQAVVSGVLYGVAVYFFMNRIVLPLSAAAKSPFSLQISTLEDRWLTPRLTKMGLDEKGMGWHSFKRFRKTWLRGTRCLEDINNFWMAHKPHTMSEVYSHLHEDVECASMKLRE